MFEKMIYKSHTYSTRNYPRPNNSGGHKALRYFYFAIKRCIIFKQPQSY